MATTAQGTGSDDTASAASAASAASTASGEEGLVTTPQHDDVAAMGYEQARDELVDIVARLENGRAGLEESMRLWERGEVLAAHCDRWLDAAQARVTGGREQDTGPTPA